MPQGLQIRDASGNITFDTNTRAGRIVGSLFTSGLSGSVTDPLLEDGAPFYFFVPNGGYLSFSAAWPDVTISGSTLSYEFPGTIANDGLKIIYGVF